MTAFALDLDPGGIRLLQKSDDRWIVLDRAALDDPDLATRLKAMCETGKAAAEGAFETRLVIPPSQILYTSIPAPADVSTVTDDIVLRALEGLTPCPIDEVVFDWRLDGDTIRIAALDVNTLDEAESFAVTYGFNPARFTAWPEAGEFPEPPDFGATQFVRQASGANPVFTTNRDVAPVAAPETALPDARETPPVVAVPEPPATAVQRPAPTVGAAPEPPAVSRRPIHDRERVAFVAAAVFAGVAILVWAALALVSPDPAAKLPEVAETPKPQTDEPSNEPGPTPRRSAPALALTEPIPEFPGRGSEPDTLPAMAARSATDILAVAAPDPATEVGMLDSADIWQTPPPPLVEPIADSVDALYLASIDPVVTVDDAFALNPPEPDEAGTVDASLPPAAGEDFALDARGLVEATPEGALTPSGVIVTAGPPPRRPPVRPTTAFLVQDPKIALALAGKSPRPRPKDLVQRMERSVLGGRTRAELARLRPKARPESPQQQAAPVDDRSSPLAVAVSRAPSYRPDDFAAIVAAAQAAIALRPENDTAVVAASAAVVAPVAPTIPSSASVARQATIEDAINLKRLNLIGVYGSASDRRALIRLPSGRYMKVKVGDRIDGGQVAAIGDNELQYVKHGKSHLLKVPSS